MECNGICHWSQSCCLWKKAVCSNTLHNMNHPQPVIPIVTDNKVTQGIINDTIEQSWSKAIGMFFYWRQTRPICHLLVTRQLQSRWLLYQASHSHPPPLHASHLSPWNQLFSVPNSWLHFIFCSIILLWCADLTYSIVPHPVPIQHIHIISSPWQHKPW